MPEDRKQSLVQLTTRDPVLDNSSQDSHKTSNGRESIGLNNIVPAQVKQSFYQPCCYKLKIVFKKKHEQDMSNFGI